MNIDPSKLIALFDERVGRAYTTILAWLMFLVLFVTAIRILMVDLIIPLEVYFGGTGDFRKDIISADAGPLWASLISTLVVMTASVLLFMPAFNWLATGRGVPRSVLDSLEDKRSWAIHHVWNFFPKDDTEFENWKRNDAQFVSEVVEILKKHFSPGEVLRFTRLGIIPIFAPPYAFNTEHANKVVQFAKRLDTLEKLIDRYARG